MVLCAERAYINTEILSLIHVDTLINLLIDNEQNKTKKENLKGLAIPGLPLSGNFMPKEYSGALSSYKGLFLGEYRHGPGVSRSKGIGGRLLMASSRPLNIKTQKQNLHNGWFNV